MNTIHIFILSIIEGLTEFLPISSTGHLILAIKLLNIAETDFVKTFEVVIQLGAILAVLVVYFKKLISSFTLIKKLIVAFIPTGIVGLIFFPFIKNFLGSTVVTLNGLFWGGIAIIAVERFLPRKKDEIKKTNEVGYKQVLIIGIFQSLSVIPGVSRSAATIIGGLLTGLNRSAATEFSFLLAIPTMLAATGYIFYKSCSFIALGEVSILAVGIALSFLFALLAIKLLLNYVKKHNFTLFGIYRIILSALFALFVK